MGELAQNNGQSDGVKSFGKMLSSDHAAVISSSTRIPPRSQGCHRVICEIVLPKRRHSTIGYLSPMEFERQAGLA